MTIYHALNAIFAILFVAFVVLTTIVYGLILLFMRTSTRSLRMVQQVRDLAEKQFDQLTDGYNRHDKVLRQMAAKANAKMLAHTDHREN